MMCCWLSCCCCVVVIVVVALLSIARVWGHWRRRHLKGRTAHKSLAVVMLHPDLGLGGAERLVVDAAVGLTQRGHVVRMVTNYHNAARAFAETTDGRVRVVVAGGWIPRHVKGRGHVLFASARMIAAAVYVSLVAAPCDCFIVDQVAAAMPVLRFLTGAPVVFYCHFPDQLCDPNRAVIGGRFARRGGFAQTVLRLPRYAYRAVFDALEGATMRAATRIACNSKYSRSVTIDTFPFLRAAIDEQRDVLYPPINIPALTAAPDLAADSVAADLDRQLATRTVVLSINRYERKKDLALAVRCFGQLFGTLSAAQRKDLLLVMAGGYDPRLAENVEYHQELVALATSVGIPNDAILFLRSFSDATKKVMLQRAAIVVYTPTGEHFGIVPVEAMAYGRPVVAVASGGPLESITTSRQVGLLCDPTPEAFAAALRTLLVDGAEGLSASDLRKKMGDAARRRCDELFSLPSFATRLEEMMREAIQQQRR
jgi:alpha-1,3/alpha-1,6-mannosyltransferase